MANTTTKENGQLEFIIRVYPGGLFSAYLDSTLAIGDEPPVTGPFGVFTLRDSPADLVFVGGGAGMAPILSVLRSLAERDPARRSTFYYGARGRRDLSFDKELRALGEAMPAFRYVPALSELGDDETWDGEVGLITDVVRRHEKDLRKTDAYVCGPPPMVEAAIVLLDQLGVPEARIFYDKFTTTGAPDNSPVTGTV